MVSGYPGIRDDGKNELCRLPSRCVKSSAVRAPCLVCFLEVCPDNGRSIVVDLEVVSPDPLGLGESFSVLLEVSGLRLNDPD